MEFEDTYRLLSIQRQKNYSGIDYDDLLTNFIDDANDILIQFDIDEDIDIYLEDIILVPWTFIKIYHEQRTSRYNWPYSRYAEVGSSFIRLFEFLLHVWSLKSICLNSQYLEFDHNVYNDLYHYYLKNSEALGVGGFNIVKNKKRKKYYVNFKDKICDEKIMYPPNGKVGSVNEFANPVGKFFKLDEYAERVYENDDSEGNSSRNSNGQWGQRFEYDSDEIDVERILISKTNGDKGLSNQHNVVKLGGYIPSPTIDKNSEKVLGFRPAYDNSAYKRFKISNAISNKITKNNLNLNSAYDLPEIELMSMFIKSQVINDNSWQSNLLLLSILTGIHYEQIVRSLLSLDNSIQINLEKNYFTYQLDNKIFAKNNILLAEYALPTSASQKIKFQLPQNILFLFSQFQTQLCELVKNSKELKKELKQLFTLKGKESQKQFLFDEVKSKEYKKKVIGYLTEGLQINEQELNVFLIEADFMHIFFEMIGKELKDFSDAAKNIFKKRIVFNINALPNTHFKYFSKLSDESNISMLFFKRVTKSEAVQLGYSNVPSFYTIHTSWLEQLSTSLGVADKLYNRFEITSKREVTTSVSKKHTGSPFRLKKQKSKMMFHQLKEAYYKAENRLIADVIVLIYIRYGLSLALMTRAAYNSCDLSQYFPDLGILLLQEKNQDEKSSKRAIPITAITHMFIEVFFKIQNKYGFTESTPVLLERKEGQVVSIQMKKSNVTTWLRENNIDIDLEFFKHVPLNFGRHAATSMALNCSYGGEFLDAMMNHYQMGSEDQGEFSTQSNIQYIDMSKEFLKDLINEYIPPYGMCEVYILPQKNQTTISKV